MKKLIFPLVLAITILSACGGDPLTEGRVIDRTFVPAHEEDFTNIMWVPRTEIYYTTQCSGYGTTQTCHQVAQTRTRMDPVYYPDTHWVKDDWDIQIKFCEKDDKGEEECRTDRVDVSNGLYDDCVLNTYYIKDEGCNLR